MLVSVNLFAVFVMFCFFDSDAHVSLPAVSRGCS